MIISLSRRAAVVGLLSFIGSQAATAQTAPAASATIRLLPEDAARGRNGHQHNFYFLPPGVGGENYKSAGFFGQRLWPYLGANTEALANLDQYRRQKTIFLIDRFVSLGALGLYGQQVLAKSDDTQYFNTTQQVAAGIFVASLLATIVINRHTNEHLQRAVSAYNSTLPGQHGYQWQRLMPSTIGVAAAPTGQPLLAMRWALR